MLNRFYLRTEALFQRRGRVISHFLPAASSTLKKAGCSLTCFYWLQNLLLHTHIHLTGAAVLLELL